MNRLIKTLASIFGGIGLLAFVASAEEIKIPRGVDHVYFYTTNGDGSERCNTLSFTDPNSKHAPKGIKITPQYQTEILNNPQYKDKTISFLGACGSYGPSDGMNGSGPTCEI